MVTFVYMNTKEIGNVIKKSRKAQNLTEYGLAKATGIKIDTIKSIESGKGFNIIKLLHICAELKIEMKLIQRHIKPN